jgi:DNA polymerase III alpha subunit
VPDNETEKSYLDKLVYRGLAWRYGDMTELKAEDLTIPAAKKMLPKEVLQRAEYELGIIDHMGL